MHLCWGLKEPLVSRLLLIADHSFSHLMTDCGLHRLQEAIQPHFHLYVCTCVVCACVCCVHVCMYVVCCICDNICSYVLCASESSFLMFLVKNIDISIPASVTASWKIDKSFFPFKILTVTKVHTHTHKHKHIHTQWAHLADTHAWFVKGHILPVLAENAYGLLCGLAILLQKL